MLLKATITDLQTRKVWRGTLSNREIILGRNLEINLDNQPSYCFRVGHVRGWLISVDTEDTYYIVDGYGDRFKLRITNQLAIDSK